MKTHKKTIPESIVSSMIRVNHAGEYGAKRIYEGQMAAIHDEHSKGVIEEMYQQELRHLEYFEVLIKNRRVRPTLLFPVWHHLGFALGKISGLLGKEYAMACTAAVEEVIDLHYKGQEDVLEGVESERDLRKNISKFRDEEIEHKTTGQTYVNESNGNPISLSLFMAGVRAATKLAISLSKRI